jgi:hypothetical protein
MHLLTPPFINSYRSAAYTIPTAAAAAIASLQPIKIIAKLEELLEKTRDLKEKIQSINELINTAFENYEAQNNFIKLTRPNQSKIKDNNKRITEWDDSEGERTLLKDLLKIAN